MRQDLGDLFEFTSQSGDGSNYLLMRTSISSLMDDTEDGTGLLKSNVFADLSEAEKGLVIFAFRGHVA